MEQIFSIQMNVPLGCRDGTLSFIKIGEQRIEGMLSLFQNETPLTGELSPQGEITFSGQMITMTRTFPYRAQGKINGTEIKLEVLGDHNHLTIFGEEVKP